KPNFRLLTDDPAAEGPKGPSCVAVRPLGWLGRESPARRGVDGMPTTPGSEVLQEAVRLACRAPSIIKSQPWRARAEGGALNLFADRASLVPGTDRSGRQAIISCGCALDHVRIAMLSAGWDAVIERFPNPNDPDHLASIEFRRAQHITGSQDDHAQAILV